MRKITRLTCGATAVLALALSGCSSGSEPSPAGDQSGGTPGGTSAEIGNLSMLADLVTRQSTEKRSAHLTMSVEGAGQSITGEGDMRFGDKPAMDMRMVVPEMADLSMRFVDDVFYFKLPSELEPGKSWVKVDANGTDPLSQSLGAAVEQMKQSGDPSQILKLLQDSGEITGQQREQLAGKDTTHYTVTIDVAKMAQNQQDPNLKRSMEAAIKAGVQNFPLDVWIDSENLPLRISMNMPVSAPTSQTTEQVKILVDYSDWGKQVDVVAPPAGEVAELPR